MTHLGSYVMAKRWWETKRRRNEKGHFVKNDRNLIRELWWNIKKLAGKFLSIFDT